MDPHESHPFGSVGKLRQLLEGLPDDRMIIAQVVAKDGRCWSMSPALCQQIRGGNIACLTLDHPQLETLPHVD